MGTLRVASRKGRAANPATAKMASGPRATSSAAYRRALLRLPADHRGSSLMLRPSTQPSSASPCRNADKRAWPSASSAARFTRTPISRTRSACCARATIGHAAAAPPSSVMNSRRFMARPLRPEAPHYHTLVARTLRCSAANLVVEWKSWVIFDRVQRGCSPKLSALPRKQTFSEHPGIYQAPIHCAAPGVIGRPLCGYFIHAESALCSAQGICP